MVRRVGIGETILDFWWSLEVWVVLCCVAGNEQVVVYCCVRYELQYLCH